MGAVWWQTLVAALVHRMGSCCLCCCSSDKEKAEKLAADLAKAQQQEIEASELIELFTLCGLKLSVRELETARMVLEKAAAQKGMPKGAAVFMQMEFVGAIVAHHQTMQAAGLRSGAEFVLDKEQAEAKVQEAKGVNLFSAAESGRVDGVEAYCALYPSKVDAYPLDTGHGHTPLHIAACHNSVEVAKLLIAAGAEVNHRRRTTGDTPLDMASTGPPSYYHNTSGPMCELLRAAGGRTTFMCGSCLCC